MFERWYFTHAALTLGPIPTEQLNQMVRAGRIAGHEQVWPEGSDVQLTVQRYLELLSKGTLPDWRLADVRQAAAPAKAPSAPVAAAAPATPVDWLADVQVVEGRPTPVPAIPTDWLDDIRQIEQSLRRPAAPPPASEKPAVPAQRPGTAVTPSAAVAACPDALAVSVSEAFVTAQRTLEQWLDADRNVRLLQTGQLDAIRQAPQVEAVFRAYERFGPVMRDKLRKHLNFLLENRQKYYTAVARNALKA